MSPLLQPHRHRVGPPECDGWRFCTTCGSPVRLGEESGVTHTSRFFEANLPDSSRFFVQVRMVDRWVLWMNRWDVWPDGVRAGLFTYEITRDWGHTNVYVVPDALPRPA